MTLGAALVHESDVASICEMITQLENVFNRTLHCKRLSHYQIAKFSREVSKVNVTLFSVISRKKTLGKYADAIENDNRMFYNKCAQYLLECVGDYLKTNNIYPRQVDIIFEEGPFDYDRLCNLIRKIQDTPRGTSPQIERAKLLRLIDADNIICKPKDAEPLLKIADLTAYAVYKSVYADPNQYGIVENRYASELKSRFFHNLTTGKLLGYGIKPVHYVSQITDDPNIRRFLNDISAN